MAATKSRIPFVPKASQLPTSTSSSKSIPSPAASVSHQPVSQDAVFKQKALEWVNQSLTSAGYLGDVEDVVKDLTDGVHLPDLIHSLVNESVQGISIPPKSELERRRNITCCLEALESHGFNMDGLSHKDITNARPSAIVELVKLLMMSRSASKNRTNGKQGVLPNLSGSEGNPKRPNSITTRMRRPTAPAATNLSSIARPSTPSSLPGLSTHTSPASSSQSSPGGASPNLPHAINTLGLRSQPLQDSSKGQNSPSSPSSSTSPGSPGRSSSLPGSKLMGIQPMSQRKAIPSRLTTETRRASESSIEVSSFNKMTLSASSPGIPRPSSIKGPSAGRPGRETSPPQGDQESNLKFKHVNRNERSHSEAPSGSRLLMRPQRQIVRPTAQAKSENEPVKSTTEEATSLLSPQTDSQHDADMVGKKSTSPTSQPQFSQGGLSPPKHRRRNLSEGSVFKHSILQRKSNEQNVETGPSVTNQTSKLQSPLSAGKKANTSAQGIKSTPPKGKLSNLPKSLFGGFAPRNSERKSPGEGVNRNLGLTDKEGTKSPSDSQKSIQSPLNSPQSPKSPLGEQKIPTSPVKEEKPKLEPTLDGTNTAAQADNVLQRKQPIKALVYTNALEPEATAIDETEEEESGEKFSTVKRRMSPARSISVSESQATASETSSSPTDIKKPVDLIPGDTSTKAKENCDTNETGERVFHSETERVSPDGGVGSPKALKDADHSPSEEKPAISEASIKVQPPTPTSPKEKHDFLNEVSNMATKKVMPRTSSPKLFIDQKHKFSEGLKPSPLTLSLSDPAKGVSAPSTPQHNHGHLSSKSLRMGSHFREARHISPPVKSEPLSLKQMRRLSRSVGEALNQIDMSFVDVSDLKSLNISTINKTVNTENTDSSIPPQSLQCHNSSSEDDDEFDFEPPPTETRELSTSPTEFRRENLMNTINAGHEKPLMSKTDPRSKSFNIRGPIPSALSQKYSKLSEAEGEGKGSTLPRSSKLRRSFNVGQKPRWKDDMDAENGKDVKEEGGLQEEIVHWRKMAETLEYQLSTTIQDLDKRGKILHIYESNVANLTARVHTLENALEEKDHQGSSVGKEDPKDLPSPVDNEPDFKGKGKKKKKVWKGLSLKFGKKTSVNETESSPGARKANQLLSANSPQSGPEGGLKKTWSSKENLLAEISELKEQLTHLKQQNTELRRRSQSPREPTVAPNAANPSSRPDSGEVVHPLLVFQDLDEGIPVAVVLHDEFSKAGLDQKCNTYLGKVNISTQTSWGDLDCKITAIFKHHVWSIDPESGMGLSDDSICTFSYMGIWRDIGDIKPPPDTPYSLASRVNPHVVIYLKGVRQKSADLLTYQLLLNTSSIESYLSLLLKHKWMVFMGTKGSFKTKMASHLARYLSNKLFGVPDKVITFSMDSDGTQISSVLEWMDSNRDNPQTYIVFIDGLFECHGTEQILNAASLMETKPYLLITIAEAQTKGSSLHSMLFKFPVRLVNCTPHNEPVNVMLLRQLRKQLLELKAVRPGEVDLFQEQLIHWLPKLLDFINNVITKYHSGSVTLGPTVFLPCPLHLAPYDLENWFISQWNHFIAPYIRGSVMAGVETYGTPLSIEWRDPKEWVSDTCPWVDNKSKDKLQSITEEDVGLNHALRISPQASIANSYYSPSIMESMVDIHSNLS